MKERGSYWGIKLLAEAIALAAIGCAAPLCIR